MDSDDDREEEHVSSWKGVPGTIILINVFDSSDKNTASIAHAASCRMVRQYLRNSNSHLIGVCLYGTENASNVAFGTKAVVDVLPLSAPTLDDYKKVRDLHLANYKQAKEFQFSEALWHASKLFANCKKQLLSRTVVLLSRLDIPPVQADQRPTFIKINDLVDANINIKVLNIAENEYEIDPFYINFLKCISKDGDFVVPKPIWNPKNIEELIIQQSNRHLAVARLEFQIGDGFSIGVGVYNLLVKAGHTYQKKVNLERETNAIITSTIKTVKVVASAQDVSPMDVDDEDQPKEMPLLKSETVHFLNYGGEKVEFSDREKNELKNPFGPPMLKLLGFKPANLLCKEKWFLKTGSFLYPLESNIEGSTKAFKAFYKACKDSEVVAICVLSTRVNAKPTIVALSPSTFTPGNEVDCGFDIIQMPFIEHVRDLNVTEEEEAEPVTVQQKNIMKDILESTRFEYKPDMFDDPKLVSKYQAIESIALDDEDLETFVDTTKPDLERFRDIPADLFEDLFGPFGAVAPKRPAASRDTGASKRFKAGEDFDESILIDRINNQTLNKYTVNELTEILKRKGDPSLPSLSKLKKSDLVALVNQYYGN